MSISENDFFQENSGSDSDDGPDYYQPISAVGDDECDSDQEISIGNGRDNAIDSSTTENPNFHGFCNGYVRAESGISTLNLNDLDEEEEEEEEEEENMREDTDSAISRAFREDENRRNAPLSPENAMRVMDAMRGISFEGFVPDWTQRVPEDRWVDQLRRLRQSPTTQN